jgi:type 1 fimbria pilin
MKKTTRLFAALACGAVSLALCSTASASSGRITFSGALVNPSCQLNLTLAPGLQSGPQGTVNASQCGNTPGTFSSTVNVSGIAAQIGTGIGQISVHDSAAGPVMEVSYN